MQADAALAREASAPGGTASYQVVRKLQAQIQALTDLVTRLPQVESAEEVNKGFGLSGNASWQTVASVSLTSPTDKSRVVVQATAQGTVLDMTSGGLTTSHCRILINGTPSAEIPAAKDAGTSVVQNILTVSSVRELAPLPPVVLVEFQMKPLNPAPFTAQPSNIANLSVYAGYSVV
ncbi:MULTISPECIES: hypothetical protein [Bacteria]|uniref:hypothetical protein n=1 Tax=Bacteria TaxID=2 RepID=UPI003C7E23D0